MSSNVTEDQFPNPFTPMAFFPPSLAFSITVSTYILIGTLSIMIWDILNNMRDEYTLLTQHKINFPAVVYYISRLSNVVSFMGQAIFHTSPIGNCARTWKILSCLICVTIPSTSLLFFCRLRAIYKDNRVVVAFFFLLWLCVCGGSSMVIVGTSADSIGPTNYCVNGSIEQFVSFGGVAVVVHDTLIFLAISWRLMKISFGEERGFNDILKTAILGKNLPAFSKAFLKDGQVYYMITVGFGIFTTVVLYIDSIPLVYRGMVGNPNLMLMNVLACRVYRNTKLGVYREGQATIVSNAANGLKHSTIADERRPGIAIENRQSRSETTGACRVGESYWEPESWNKTYATAYRKDVSPLRMEFPRSDSS